MKQAIKLILRGVGDGLSSKRVALFIFILMFIGEFVMWYVFGKSPNGDLRVELFTLLLAALMTVFGEPVMQAYGLVFGKKKVADDDLK